MTANDIARSIYGAYRLALLDPRGLQLFERTPQGALDSFFAAVLVLPAYALLELQRLWPDLEQLSGVRVVALEAVVYVIRWTLFPVLMLGIVWLIGRQARYIDYLVAYNWSGVITTAVLLPVMLLDMLGLWPGLVALLHLALTVGVLAYLWYIARTALAIGGGQAALIVIIDIIVFLALDWVVTTRLYAG